MYIPRGKLLALITFVIAASMVTATGAFTSVTAERSVDVKVAGDKSAYLALEPTNGSNGDYAKMKSNGQLAVNLDGDASGVDGQGVNPNAVTTIDNVFMITNKGTQPVKVSVEKKGNGSTDAVTFYEGTSSNTPLEDEKTLGVGDTKTIGIKVDTRGKGIKKGDKLLDAIEIQANATSTTQ